MARRGLKQADLARGLSIDDSAISRLANGQRLSGKDLRERIVTIVAWLHQQDALATVEEANALLAAADRAPLQRISPSENELLDQLDGRPAGALPPAPGLFIGRESDLVTLKRRLGIGHRTSDGTGQVGLTVIRGWPGIGKSTLLARLGYDPEVRAAYPLILWASLGENPNVVAELAAWGRALSSTALSQAKTTEEATALLAPLLENSAALLLVDDVWNAQDGEPFRRLSRVSAVIFTTRITKMAHDLARAPDDIHILHELSERESLDLLERLAPGTLDLHPAQCVQLVKVLEGMPLALQVAGRLLHVERQMGWGIDELLGELLQGRLLLESEVPTSLVELTKITPTTVAVLLQRSVARLDEETRERFALLGFIAPSPAEFDLAAISAIWQVDDPRPSIRALMLRGLLEPSGEQTFRMHAVLVLYARSLLTG